MLVANISNFDGSHDFGGGFGKDGSDFGHGFGSGFGDIGKTELAPGTETEGKD